MQKKKKIPLPASTFHRKRHWPKIEVEKASDVRNRIPNLFYSAEWQEEAQSAIGHSVSKDDLWVAFLRDIAEHNSFIESSSTKGCRLIKVLPGNTFEKLDSCTFIIDPTSEQDYSNLIKTMRNDFSGKIKGFIHMWDCIPVGSNMTSFDALKHSQDQSAFSAFHLIRACRLTLDEMDFRFVTLTSYAQKVDGSEKTIDPSRMPALGINKVISQEYPLVQSLVLDVDLDKRTEKMVFSEIFETSQYSNTFVAFRNEKRYLQTLEKINLEKLTLSSTTIREGGTYLIAGGAGYLGLETALYLASRAKVNIALIGRRSHDSFTKKQHEVIKKLEEMGSKVLYLHGDLTDNVQCESCIDEIHNKFGLINGVYVAIKNISHQLLEKVSPENFKRNILSKIKGTWLLDKLTEKDNLDFFATFSSISSLTGGPTGADCSASNLFLDSLTDYRKDQGKKTITMNYTLIDADDLSLLSDRMSMIPPITKEEFIQTLDIFMTKELPFALVSDFDGQVMSKVLPFMKIRFSKAILDGFEAANEVPSTSKVRSEELNKEELNLEIKNIWKDVLGYEDIADNANFFDIGGDSISAIKLIHLCKVQLQVELKVADLYAHPILSDLLKFIWNDSDNGDEDDEIAKMLNEIESGALDPSQGAMMLK